MSPLAKAGWMLIGGGCAGLILVSAGYLWLFTRKWYI